MYLELSCDPPNSSRVFKFECENHNQDICIRLKSQTPCGFMFPASIGGRTRNPSPFCSRLEFQNADTHALHFDISAVHLELPVSAVSFSKCPLPLKKCIRGCNALNSYCTCGSVPIRTILPCIMTIITLLP